MYDAVKRQLTGNRVRLWLIIANPKTSSSDFQETIIGEAVKAAVEQTSAQVIAGKDKLVTRTVIVEGLIAAVDGGQIILNVGAKAGVKVGSVAELVSKLKTEAGVL